MLEKLLKDTKFLKLVKDFYKKNPEIIDIILFGSAVKGKKHPEDIDILVLFSRAINHETLTYFEKMTKQYKFEVTGATYADLFSPKFLPRDTIFDGISLITKKTISEGFGYKSFVLFKYNLKGFTNSKRVRFFYALRGRYGTGILKEMGYRVGKDTFLIFSNKSEEFKKFLDSWGIEYQEIETLIPERREVVLS